MALADTGTLLEIIPIAPNLTPALTPYSARGLTESFGRLPGNQRRTINGELIDLTPEQFRKYTLSVSCTDQETPALDDAYIGQTVTVRCASEFSYPVGGSAQRTVVSGSSRTPGGTGGDFTFYRPELTMMVLDIKTSFAEWPADKTFQIDLEEV